jgi:hypothetical protein
VPDERGAPTVTGLVELMYRADWTGLSADVDVTEFEDYEVRHRIAESRRPSWAPPPGPGTGPDRQAGGGPGGRWAAVADEDDEDDEESQGEGDAEVPGESESWPSRETSYRLLIEPGGRFRCIRDDDSPWETGPAPCTELLSPAWLPAMFELDPAGPGFIAGRRAYRVIGRPRPVSRGRARRGRSALRPAERPLIFGLESVDRVDAYVDAELGILLRSERLFRGQVVGRSEVTGLSLDPPAHSHLDDDLSEGETAGESAETGADESAFSGPGWERLKATANAGAAAMGFAIRHAPHREAPAGSRPGSPPDYPATSRDTGWPGPPGPDEPVSAQIIALLYDAGLSHTAFDAELRTWADAATAAAAFRHMTRNANLSGVNRLADAMTQRATTWQGRDTVRIGLPGRYRIDYVDGGKANRKSSTEACDGEQRWRVFPGHVTVGVALPLPSAIARMVDPAWLLEWRLTGGAHVVEGGRAGFLIRVSRRSLSAAATSTPSTPAEAVGDAELGILLRLSQEQGGRPSMQQSFSDLTVRPQSEPGDYRVTIPAGTRVVKDSGTVLDEVELSAPVQTAVQLAVKGLGTAARVGGFLQSLRQQGKDRGA